MYDYYEGFVMSDEELFNLLARVYIERELLINKISDGKETTLSEAEKKVNSLIEDDYLIKLIEMLDRFFLIKGHRNSVSIVRSYRYRLNQFINRTIGFEDYSFLLGLSAENLERRLKENIGKLLERKDSFPLLKAQLSILLRWFKR